MEIYFFQLKQFKIVTLYPCSFLLSSMYYHNLCKPFNAVRIPKTRFYKYNEKSYLQVETLNKVNGKVSIFFRTKVIGTKRSTGYGKKAALYPSTLVKINSFLKKQPGRPSTFHFTRILLRKTISNMEVSNVFYRLLIIFFIGVKKSYFTHYSYVVIILFKMGLCRSAFSIISFKKLVFHLSVFLVESSVLNVAICFASTH